MGSYEILWRRSAPGDLDSLPKKDMARIISTIRLLSANPRPPGCRKLGGREHYRIRQGDYRILYSVQDDEQSVWIVKIAHRREAYR